MSKRDPGVPEDVRQILLADYERIRWHVRRHVRDAAQADEVMQAFCERVLDRADRLKQGAAARAWLARVLQTVLADHFRANSRRRRRETSLEDHHLQAHVEEPSEILAAICACMNELLTLLPASEAALVSALDLRTEKRSAVAAASGVTEGALAVRLHRARKRLRALALQFCRSCVDDGFRDCACDRRGGKVGTARRPSPDALAS